MLMRDWWKGKEPCLLIPIETHDRPRAGWSVVPSIRCSLQPASIIVDISGSHMIRVGGGITIDLSFTFVWSKYNPESLLWLPWSDFYSSSFSPVSLQQFRHAHCKNFSASRGNCDRFHSWHFDLSQQRKHRRINDGSIPLSGDPATCDELKCLHGKRSGVKCSRLQITDTARKKKKHKIIFFDLICLHSAFIQSNMQTVSWIFSVVFILPCSCL